MENKFTRVVTVGPTFTAAFPTQAKVVSRALCYTRSHSRSLERWTGSLKAANNQTPPAWMRLLTVEGVRVILTRGSTGVDTCLPATVCGTSHLYTLLGQPWRTQYTGRFLRKVML